MKLFSDKKKSIIGKEEIKSAYQTLKKYKQGKTNLEDRIVSEEQFWKGRHWEAVRSKDDKSPMPTSAWMFNSIINKHADAMDALPEAICHPMESDDTKSAEMLTSILPPVLRKSDFEQVYSDNWWYKLKHGFCVYGVFWDNTASDGKGDVVTTKIDALNIFCEPGITDVQKSRNIFILDLIPVDMLKEQYPKLDIKGGESGDLKQYVFDDAIDTSDKALVVDWYYKKNGKLHYCKFCEENVLFASENEDGYENGWYEDGEYPVVFDVLFPEAGTIYGFGYIAITKDPQLYIDKLDADVADNLHVSSKPRYFAKISAGVNEQEFLDLSRPIVHVEGDIEENRLKPIQTGQIPNQILSFRQAKIDELKETSSNRDFNQGGTSGGVTAASAVAVIVENGNKTTRDSNKSSYRSFVKIICLIIERFRQFYTYERTFRIVGKGGKAEFMPFDNKGLQPQLIEKIGEEELFRKPIFDIDVKAQKQNPFSTLAQNETAMNLWKSGLLDPQNAQIAIPVIKMMTFEGKDEILRYVQEGMTLQNQLTEALKQNQRLEQQLTKMQGTASRPLPAVAPSPVMSGGSV